MKTFAKFFLIAESCLLVLPCALWLGVLHLNTVIPCGPALYKLSIYFIPAALIRSGFGKVKGIMMPCNPMDWLVVIAFYTIISLGMAILATIITKLAITGTQNKAPERTAKVAAQD